MSVDYIFPPAESWEPHIRFLLAMNDPRLPLSDNAQGALWMLASVAGATGMTIAVRLLTPELHISMIVFLRAGIGDADNM